MTAGWPESCFPPAQWPRGCLDSTRRLVVVSAWVSLECGSSSSYLSSFPPLLFFFPLTPQAISPMATQSQQVPQTVSQQQSSPPKSPKRSFFTRSSSNRRSKNNEIQSTSPPQI